jgi:hypothetical protein
MYRLKIVSEPRWNAAKKQHEYKLERDGAPFKNGEWVLESELDPKPRQY